MDYEINLSHLILKEVDDWGNLTEYGVEQLRLRAIAAKARDTVRRRYHTVFEWVKPEAMIYSAAKELVDEARAKPLTPRQEQARCMEVSGLQRLQELRERIAAL